MLSHNNELILAHSATNSQKKSYTAPEKQSITFIDSHPICPRQLNAGVLMILEQK